MYSKFGEDGTINDVAILFTGRHRTLDVEWFSVSLRIALVRQQVDERMRRNILMMRSAHTEIVIICMHLAFTARRT